MYTGPNIEKDGLVFGYDTGYGIADNNTATRFYQGKPSSPLRGTFPSGTTLPSGYVWTYEYDNVVVDAPITNHFLSNQKWVKSTRDTTGSTRVMFLNNSFTAGTTYTWSCYVYCVDSNLTSLAMVSHNGGYSAHQGGVTYTNSDIGTVKRIHGTWIQQQNGGSIYGMQTNNASIGTQFFMTGFQVEQSDIETPLTSTTRSSTQSLIDLKRTTDIDLSNVSFDSTGQPEFDGTDDYLQINAKLLPATGAFTMEFLYQISTTGGRGGMFERNPSSPYNGALIGQGGSGNWGFQVNNGSQSLTINDMGYPSTNTWYHDVGVYDGVNTIKFYRNGSLHDTVTGSTIGSIDSGGPRDNMRYMKRDNNSNTIGGKVAVSKVYNQALSAQEVKQNFNAYKNRFDI